MLTFTVIAIKRWLDNTHTARCSYC